MGLNFSSLEKLAGGDPKEQTPRESVPGKKRLEADQKQIQAEQERRAAYADAIRLSEQTRIEITKGFKAGEPLPALFLKACKVISLITGDKCFYNQIEAGINDRDGGKEA